MSIRVKQLSTYKHGMKSVVSLDSFRSEFERRLEKARKHHAKLAGARIAKAYRMEFGFSAVDIYLLANMAEKHQVSQQYLPVAVAQAKKLLNA